MASSMAEAAKGIVINEKRQLHGYEKPEAQEVHGKVAGFAPAGDYILVRRLKSIDQDGMIVRPEVAVELAERGVVVAVSAKAAKEGYVTGVVAKFSKYGAEEIVFDDAESERYALVRTHDVRGWHRA